MYWRRGSKPHESKKKIKPNNKIENHVLLQFHFTRSLSKISFNHILLIINLLTGTCTPPMNLTNLRVL